MAEIFNKANFLKTQNHRKTIGVLGAGIMGCCLALELAQRGYQVDLFDRANSPMTGASLHNEGKLHLGFVYAKDDSQETHKQMARGSLSFASILEKLTDSKPSDMQPSAPFQYFVPTDSLLDLGAIRRHFNRVEETLHEHSQQTGDQYLGRRIGKYFGENSAEAHCRYFSSERTMGSFWTHEVSVSPVAVANLLTTAIEKEPNINFRGNSHVHAVTKLPSGDLRVGTQRSSDIYPCVVNCLWENKLYIDETAGILTNEAWILRYKATITIPTGNNNLDIPSATGILGKYGDVVRHANGSTYISWYPLCKLSEGINETGDALRGRIHPSRISQFAKTLLSISPGISKIISNHTHRKFIEQNITAMAGFIPGMNDLLSLSRYGKVGGGIILAKGQTDIDDPQSRLHQRSQIGPAVYENYITVDTGKYCMAPLFAVETANLVVKVI